MYGSGRFLFANKLDFIFLKQQDVPMVISGKMAVNLNREK